EDVLVGGDRALDVGLDGAGEAGEGGAEGEGEELEAEAVDAHGFGCGLVLADGDPGASDAGVADPGEDGDHDGGADQYQVQVVGELPDGEDAEVVAFAEVEAEDLDVGDAGDAVGAVGDAWAGGAVHVVHGDPEDLTEAQRDDGQVVAA